MLPAHARGSPRRRSDRNIKENIASVDERVVLQQLETLSVESWNYIGDETPHMGPMAQDFKSAFNLGDSDKHIHVVDMNGVSMASIKALAGMVREQSREIEALASEIGRLKEELS